MNVRRKYTRRRGDQGFSLLELLVVVAIIMIMAAVAIPAISRYIRNYQIRGAAQAVAGELQTARSRAIAKNVNFGVVFVTIDNQTYRYVIEDDVTDPRSGVRQTVATQLADASQAGPARVLPNGITFGTGCAGFVANDSGVRFTRLGATCDPGSPNCPALGVGTNLVMNPAAGGTTVCLVQPLTTLRRTVTVSAGGRVMVQQ